MHQGPSCYRRSDRQCRMRLDHSPMAQRIGVWRYISRGGGLGRRDVKTCDCRFDCALRLHFVRNTTLNSLLTRKVCDVVHGHRLSGDRSSPHSIQCCGRSSSGGTARVSAWLLRIRIWDIQSVSLWLWNIPTVHVWVWVRNVPAV